MQSLNEELQTVNAELQSKVDDLSSVNNDMKNLLNSTDIAIVFLDASLNVRRYTTQATRLFKLIPGDVGRPLTDIVNNLLYPDAGPTLRDDTLEVLRSQVVSERHAVTRDGHWFKVRIMPYRTVENKNDGVVLTFTDITESKQREEELRKALLDRSPAK
jgi:two-component system CheB/CheR fusion protein